MQNTVPAPAIRASRPTMTVVNGSPDDASGLTVLTRSSVLIVPRKVHAAAGAGVSPNPAASIALSQGITACVVDSLPEVRTRSPTRGSRRQRTRRAPSPACHRAGVAPAAALSTLTGRVADFIDANVRSTGARGAAGGSGAADRPACPGRAGRRDLAHRRRRVLAAVRDDAADRDPVRRRRGQRRNRDDHERVLARAAPLGIDPPDRDGPRPAL